MNYYQKYLKYKAKYLELKGGVSPQCETPAFNAWVSGLKNKKEVTREEEQRIYGKNFGRKTLEKCIAERDPNIHLLPTDEDVRAEVLLKDEIDQLKEEKLSRKKFSPKKKDTSIITSPAEKALLDNKIQYCNNFIQNHTKNKQMNASAFYALLKDTSLNMTTTQIVECIKKNGVVVVIDNEQELTSGISWDELNNMANDYYDELKSNELKSNDNKLILKGDTACQKIITQRFKGRKVISQAEYDEVIADSKRGLIHFSKKTLDECLQLNGISVSQ